MRQVVLALSYTEPRTGRLAVSVLTNAEVGGARRSGERREGTRLLNSLRPYRDRHNCPPCGRMRRRYRRSHDGIGLIDYLIAATADVHGPDLATLNVEHIPRFASLKPRTRIESLCRRSPFAVLSPTSTPWLSG